MSRAKYDARYNASPKGKFNCHKGNAKKRGVPFLLTFDQWWDIWQRSGKWDKRGCKPGCYVMARRGDTGPYAVYNVDIVKFTRNLAEGRITRWRGRTKTVLFTENLC